MSDSEKKQQRRVRFPPEVIIEVLAHLRPPIDDDNRANTHFARYECRKLLQVSRLFRSTLLPFLFETLTVEKFTHYDNAAKDWCTNISFYSAICHKDQHALSLAKHVRKCTFMGHWHKSEYSSTLDDRDPVDEVYDLALSEMPNITSMSIRSMTVDENMLVQIGRMQNLRSLSITGIRRVPSTLTPNFPRKVFRQLFLHKRTTFELTHFKIDPEATQEIAQCLAEVQWELACIALHSDQLTDTYLRNGKHSLLRDVSLDPVDLRSDPIPFINFLHNTPTIQALRIKTVVYSPSNLPSGEKVPPLLLENSALPLLSTIQCPGGWIKYFVPGRPVRDVNIQAVFRESRTHEGWSIEGDSSGMEESVDCLLYIQDSSAALQRLRLTPKIYVSHLLTLQFQPGFSIHELIFDLFRSSKPSTVPIMPSPNVVPDMEGGWLYRYSLALSGQLSKKVNIVRFDMALQDRYTYDLKYQLSTVNLFVEMAFPQAATVQLCRYFEWHRDPTTKDVDKESLSWRPALLLQGSDAFAYFRYLMNRYYPARDYGKLWANILKDHRSPRSAHVPAEQE